MHRSAVVPCALWLLAGCASSPPPVVVVVTRDAPVATAGPLDANGRWSGSGWGEVVLRGDGTGTYTDTYGTGPGRIEFHAAGGGYEGRWMESARRFGTLRFAVAEDGRAINGEWTPDPECILGTTTGGAIRWTRDAIP